MPLREFLPDTLHDVRIVLGPSEHIENLLMRSLPLEDQLTSPLTTEQILDLPLVGCNGFRTVREFETNFIQPSCGKNSTCHNGVFEPRYKKADTALFTRFAGVRARTLCADTNTFYIDLERPNESFILRKTKMEAPICADGITAAGAQMPYQEEPLDQNAQTCLESYAFTVAFGVNLGR